ncbi:D-alanyl-D-alanine carboxypeptidase family protein [[Lactobacillus] timonensis]|uniref:D-alanyl-D-alanine carboxypeptidase family protein n=1 Tax=[Lactobacillus] timonensis TaxID=1970790 RepID=UPI0038B59BF7
MVDASTGQIIYEQDANQKLPIASISKLLTVAVIHDELKKNAISAYTKVKVTSDISEISNDPNYSSIGLQEGQSYSVIELLNAAMVKSADGATAALATADGSSPDAFVLSMDKKAKEIGLTNASIINPTGLTNGEMKNLCSDSVSDDAENEMTARDVALLARYLIHSYPALLKVTAQKKANFFISKGNTKSVKNLNKMLPGCSYTVPGVTISGLKTGTSDKAGACFVSVGKYRGHQIITVVLHANGENDDSRFIQTQKLYRMLKDDYCLQTVDLTSSMSNVQIAGGNRKTIATSPKQLTVWGKKRLKSYTIAQSLEHRLVNKRQQLCDPVKKGQRIGSIRLTSKQLRTVSGEPLTYPLKSDNAVGKGTLITKLFN